jgi:hypothetical protein
MNKPVNYVTDRDFAILCDRLDGLTYVKIGTKHGITKERVRQITIRLRRLICQDLGARDSVLIGGPSEPQRVNGMCWPISGSDGTWAQFVKHHLMHGDNVTIFSPLRHAWGHGKVVA